MKLIRILIPILLAAIVIACGTQTETKAPEPVIEKADSKVKVRFDGKNQDLEVETDKVDIKLD